VFFNAAMCLSSVSTVPYTYGKTQSLDGFAKAEAEHDSDANPSGDDKKINC